MEFALAQRRTGLMRRSARRFQQLARQRLPATRPVFPPAAAEAAAPLVDTRVRESISAHFQRIFTRKSRLRYSGVASQPSSQPAE